MNPFQPINKCPSCGSTNLKLGSRFVEDEDYENWECNDCHAGGGGASFWQ